MFGIVLYLKSPLLQKRHQRCFSFTFLWNIFTWYSIWIGFLHTTDMNLVKSTQIRIRDNLTVGIFNHLQPSICFYLFLSVLSVLSVFISFLLVFYLFSIYFYLLSTIFNCFYLFLFVCICWYLFVSVCICLHLVVFVCICFYLFVSVCICIYQFHLF